MKNTIDELVILLNYNTDWPRMAKKECANIKAEFGINNIKIEHIGSTAIAGLVSKPTIDLQLGIPSCHLLKEVTLTLKKLGYEDMGEAGVPGRYYFRKRKDSAYNVHVVLLEGDIWKNNLLVRNYLRNHKEEAERYAQIKQKAIDNGLATLLAYSDYKAAFILELIYKAQKHQDTKP